MAAGAVIYVADAFLGMFGDDLHGLVCVATIAGVCLELVALVACHACHIVPRIELEIAIMREIGRLPRPGRMALRAPAGDRGVQTVLRLVVAGGALARNFRLQQSVIEILVFGQGQQDGGMIGMAGHAIRLAQLGVESRHLGIACWQALCRRDADPGGHMACHASRRRGTPQRCMAGKAILLQFGMRGDQRSRRDHLVRIDKQQDEHSCQRQGDCGEQAMTLHFQPQNKQMAMMWANASPAKASVIGKWITRHCLMAFIVRLSPCVRSAMSSAERPALVKA